MATRRGTARDERLDGTARTDTLLGLAGRDRLFGLAGNDVLDGGQGADVMSGGRGDDLYIVDDAGDRVIEQHGQGIDTVRAGVSHTLAAEVENLVLTGTAAVAGSGNGGDNHLVGNGARNTLDGGAGDDLLDGGGGVDTLRGGAGDDTYIVNSAAVRVVESGDGDDIVRTSASYTLPPLVETLVVFGDQFVQGTGNRLGNIMLGAAGINVLDGAGGDDFLDGGAGNDILRGGTGDDIFVVDRAGDSVVENPNQGRDTVRTALDAYTLPANVENLELRGTRAIAGTGNELANRLVGNAAANHLAGGDGNDVLDGRGGADVMEGGPGNDSYVVDNVGDRIDESAPVTLLQFGFQNLRGDQFDNPGTRLKVAAIGEVSAWTTQDPLTLIGAGLNGFDAEPNRGRAIGATGFDDGSEASAADDGNAFQFTFAIGTGQHLDITGFSFNEQGSNGARGNGPSDWLIRINGHLVATGAVTLGNPGGHQHGDIALDALTGLGGSVTVTIAAHGSTAANGTWRIDDFTLSGSVGGGGTDRVESSVDFTLPAGVEQLKLSGTQALHGTGNEFANIITGNAGNNLLDGAGGADRVDGGAGDDVLVYDALDVLLDGGPGNDTLRIDGAGVHLDLRVVDDTRLLHIEHIALGGSGDNSLALDASDVLALAGANNTLRISGETGDALVSTGQGWVLDGAVQTIGAAQYQSYSAGAAHLLVDVDLTASLS